MNLEFEHGRRVQIDDECVMNLRPRHGTKLNRQNEIPSEKQAMPLCNAGQPIRLQESPPRIPREDFRSDARI